MSQIVVPTDTPGLRGQPQARQAGQALLRHRRAVFDDVRVPVANTIGEVGRGFQQQMEQFQNERMIACLHGGRRACERALDRTRRVPASSARRSASRCTTTSTCTSSWPSSSAEVDLLRHYNYACAEAYMRGEDTTRYATIAKLKAGRLCARSPTPACSSTAASATWRRPGPPASSATRLLSIGGGADEVMLQVLAKMHGM